MKTSSKALSGVSAAALVVALTGCSSSSAAGSPPSDPECKDWDYDSKDQVWECDDDSSGHHGSYYHNGTYYKTRSSLHKSSSFKSYKKSSGFGSGSRSVFGG
ncbi:hypothetical protein [Priestia koreensis]|uniref:hypothetical protein n=1 Tax=Priestia koreensis TaxID=284581 RepID=UPI001F5A57FA|nr:hypothetical protein [Priestia koreensis]MCM3004134.1 hypothetical protein [Priestia koreensis]UNL83354.1 hypothetical protein IE339_14370 [Priestia koreensis]